MKIFAGGSWHKNKIKRVKEDIKKVGRRIAENDHDLITGGGSGVSEIAASSYLEHGGRKHIIYDVAPKFRKIAGEKRAVKAHKTIKTGKEYPIRNNIMVKNCDLMIAFNGGLGIWGEIFCAVGDYGKKVIIFEKGFANSTCLKRILKGRKNIFYVKKAEDIYRVIGLLS